MTPADFIAAQDAIGWSNVQLAARLAMNETQIRRWRNGRATPRAAVADWLRTLADFHEAHPAPARPGNLGA